MSIEFDKSDPNCNGECTGCPSCPKDLWDEKPESVPYDHVTSDRGYLEPDMDVWLEKIAQERSDLTNDLMDAERTLKAIRTLRAGWYITEDPFVKELDKILGTSTGGSHDG